MSRDLESEFVELRERLYACDRSTEALTSIFADLAERLGSVDASRLWWRAFGETDASET